MPAQMSTLWDHITHAYDKHIQVPGKETHFLILMAFLLSFGFIRTSTHMIKAGVSWWPGNVETKGGTHIHHMFWGILLLISMGYIGLATDVGDSWYELIAILFGIGMGLTIDEFALWLNLEDVYWSEKGRQSIDAAIVTTVMLIIALIGLQFWIDIREALFLFIGVGGERFTGSESVPFLLTTQVIGAGLAIITVLKGRMLLGIFGLFIPLVALIGALLKPRPNSWWLRRRAHSTV